MFGSASGEGDSAQDAAGGRRGRSSKFARSNLPNESQRRDTAALFAAAPPVAIEAEMGLLGAVLWDPKMIGDVITVIRSGDDFSVPRHARIYDAMIELYDRHATVDLVLLNQLFLDRNLVEAVGGLDYLVQLAEGVPSAANAVHWARVVREKATTRELIAAAGEILEEAHTSRHPAQTLLENAEQKIFRIAQKRETGIVASAQELVNETMRLIDESEGKGFMGVRTGFAELDEMTNGFQKGEMIVLAARPSMGKTAMLIVMPSIVPPGTTQSNSCAPSPFRNSTPCRCNTVSIARRPSLQRGVLDSTVAQHTCAERSAISRIDICFTLVASTRDAPASSATATNNTRHARVVIRRRERVES